MFSRCSHCQSLQRVTTKQLRRQRGLLQCRHCKQRFDALATLSEKAEQVPGNQQPAWPLPERSAVDSRFWLAGNVVMLVVLLTQLAYFNREQIMRQPFLRVARTQICEHLPCGAEPAPDPGEWAISHSDLQAGLTGYYRLSAAMTNQSESTQTFPDLQVTLMDFNGQPVAERTFEPWQYAAASPLAGAETRAIELWLAAPAATIGGFTVTLL